VLLANATRYLKIVNSKVKRKGGIGEIGMRRLALCAISICLYYGLPIGIWHPEQFFMRSCPSWEKNPDILAGPFRAKYGKSTCEVEEFGNV
jgi:hypothetical protein